MVNLKRNFEAAKLLVQFLVFDTMNGGFTEESLVTAHRVMRRVLTVPLCAFFVAIIFLILQFVFASSPEQEMSKSVIRIEAQGNHLSYNIEQIRTDLAYLQMRANNDHETLVNMTWKIDLLMAVAFVGCLALVTQAISYVMNLKLSRHLYQGNRRQD